MNKSNKLLQLVQGLSMALLLTAMVGSVAAQDAPEPTPPMAMQGVSEPESRPFSEDLMSQLQLPDGFALNIFAQGLDNPRIMAPGPNGTVYVSQRSEDNVLALIDRDGDGVSDETHVVAQNIPFAHGLTVRDNQLYIAGNTTLYVTTINEDGGLVEPAQVVVDDLPEGGQHSARTMAFGADGMLYLNIGSSCNACNETDEEYATLLRFAPDFSSREIFASGLRHTIGFGWHPVTSELWGMDHGTDALGDDIPPEELNSIVQGQNYGWPFCYGDREINWFLPGPFDGTSKEEFCAASTPATIAFQAHSSPIGFTFYTGSMFPAEYQNDAFVAMRGSWNRSEPTGYKVVHLDFDENGQPIGFSDFLTGFLIADGAAQFARVAGLHVLPDGSLLVADDSNGIIYRVSYTGA